MKWRENSGDCNRPATWSPKISVEEDWTSRGGFTWRALEDSGHAETLEEAQSQCELAVWRSFR